MPKYKVGKFTIIAPSKFPNKKYDVYDNDSYITSFGDSRYEQYYDKFGYYSNLNHYNKKRQLSYQKRHQNDNLNDPHYAGFWSYHFLW